MKPKHVVKWLTVYQATNKNSLCYKGYFTVILSQVSYSAPTKVALNEMTPVHIQINATLKKLGVPKKMGFYKLEV
jgi:hypothetical protein